MKKLRMILIRWLAGSDIIVMLNGTSTPEAVVKVKAGQPVVSNWCFDHFDVGIQLSNGFLSYGVTDRKVQP
jgi:hypothetical protein